MTISKTRRQFLTQSACGLATVAIASVMDTFNPRLARAEGQPFTRLTVAEARTLEALGDTLMPGAAEAGIAHYIDSQIGSDSPLLMLSYLDFPMPLADFYSQGLAAVNELANRRHQAEFADLDDETRAALVGQIAAGLTEPWPGPPPQLFYFTLRADAVDVVCGTEEGFATLGIPYLAHITPPSRW